MHETIESGLMAAVHPKHLDGTAFGASSEFPEADRRVMESLNVLINRRPNGSLIERGTCTVTSAHVLSRLAERAPEPRAQGRLEMLRIDGE